MTRARRVIYIGLRRCPICERRLWPWQRRSPLNPNPAHRMCAIEDLLRPTADARLAGRLNIKLVSPSTPNTEDQRR